MQVQIISHPYVYVCLALGEAMQGALVGARYLANGSWAFLVCSARNLSRIVLQIEPVSEIR
jgi:hypothetical protein